ncbi:hypothetical protein GIY62_10895 [Burkholderia plantarii]|uniref:CS1 type fimbrial major subunit n=1 Tax=Burkholderia plantarii TaxID=41899 RepID=A0A0B6RUA4_BURPL|nr:CS1 type fimbrial major subunit [Burkholderia plantarii]AJK44665.1 hypothetical protein BGL_1c01120 [Burkholderia plantarii]WLE57673.1 hypothetical protein GIY62_10895 [Burkholderia plantarii]
MLSKLAFQSLVAASVAAVGIAHADTVQQNIQLRATVPSGTSYVKAVGGWPADAVDFVYDQNTQKLRNPPVIGLRMRNNMGTGPGAGGVILASLSYPIVLSDGVATDDLPVQASISGSALTKPVVLSTTGQQIYNDKAGAEVDGALTLHVQDDAKLTPGQSYQGTAALVFDFQPAPAQ